MNLWVRFIITLLRCFRAKKDVILAPSSLYLTVMPWDCDVNIHLTNSRYFSFCDLGRTYHIACKKNLFSTMLKNKWAPIICAIDIKFIRAIRPFSRVHLTTELLGWDKHYIYMQQNFFVKNKLHATAQIQGVFMHHKSRINMQDILAVCEEPELHSPPFSQPLSHWIATLNAKKAAANI